MRAATSGTIVKVDQRISEWGKSDMAEWFGTEMATWDARVMGSPLTVLVVGLIVVAAIAVLVWRQHRSGFALTGRLATPARPECSFCGRSEVGAPLTELHDTYDRQYGYCCDSCEGSYFRLESRLTYTHAPGHRPWLVPDPGTKRVLKTAPHSVDAVHAVVGDLENEIREISRAAARIAALRLGVWGAEKVTPCDSRKEAVTTVSRMIADNLVKHYEWVQKHHEGRDYKVYTVSLFGDGCGVLSQEVTTFGDWLRQHCFLIDTEHTVHRYTSYDR